MMNSCPTELGFWIIGIDEELQEFTGCDEQELANWWPSVQKYFDEAAPLLVNHITRNPRPGVSIVALCFDGSDRPFVVSTGKSPAERWIPWRAGTRLRSAYRSEILGVVTRIQNAPLAREAVKLQLARAERLLDYLTGKTESNLKTLFGISELIELNGARLGTLVVLSKGYEVPSAMASEIEEKTVSARIRVDSALWRPIDSSSIRRESKDSQPEDTQKPNYEQELTERIIFGSIWETNHATLRNFAKDPLIAPSVRLAVEDLREAIDSVIGMLEKGMQDLWPIVSEIDHPNDINFAMIPSNLSNTINDQQPDLSRLVDIIIAEILASIGIRDFS